MDAQITVQLKEPTKGLADCPGFSYSAVATDIRDNQSGQLDLALITSQTGKALSAAAVFTQNDVTAAPVDLSRMVLESSPEKVGGIVVNSGNANACTGAYGMPDAKEMSSSAQVSSGIGLPFFVCSTGRIGRRLPINKIIEGIASAAKSLDASTENAKATAQAILTSDTREKEASASFNYEGQTITVAGIAKGAGMIEPNMATMLAFLTTNVSASHACLQTALKTACDQSFNCLSIDGDMSTNDTVILLANGETSLNPESNSELLKAFQLAVLKVCETLAYKIVSDGEKITKVVTIEIIGCQSDSDAEKVARAIGNSLLVKTAFYGSDPNWGRIVDAAGYAQVGLLIDHLDLHYDSTPALIAGKSIEDNLSEWKSIVEKDQFKITLNLNQGNGTFKLLTTDLSEAYVDFNKSE